MTKYAAIVNTPGYMPWQDDIPTFDTPAEAWEYLASERELAEDETGLTTDITVTPTEDLGYSETVNELRKHERWAASGLVADFEAVGTVYGPTPGYDGSHDLGIAYSVAVAEDES